MVYRQFVSACFSTCLVLSQSVAWAADPVVFFDTIPDGRVDFDTRISNANGTVNTDILSGLANNTTSWSRTNYTITATNNNARSVNTGVLDPAPLGGTGGEAINMTADGSVTSGLTFTFDSPINAFAIELEDWATCCHPSDLYIVFDGGTPILIGSATERSDNPGYAAGQGDTTFIGSIDDSATFSTITFYGTGSGDALYAGGIIRYATVALGSVSGSYVSTAQPSSVGSLARYLDANDDVGDLQTVAAYLNTQDAVGVERALKKIFPVNTSVNSQSGMTTNQKTADVLMEKVGSVLGDVSTHSMNLTSSLLDVDGLLPAALPDASTMSFRGGWQDASSSSLGGVDALTYLTSQPYTEYTLGDSALWVQGVTAFSDGQGKNGAQAYDSFSRGVVLGYESVLNAHGLVGLVGGLYNSDIDLADDTGSTESSQYSLGVYGQYLWGDHTKVTGMLSASRGDYESTRIVSVGGVYGVPKADYNSRTLSATVGASRLYAHSFYKIEPVLQLNYVHVHTSDYDEQNGGVYNMHVDADNYSKMMAKLSVGFKAETPVGHGEKKVSVLVKPYLAQHVQIESASNVTHLVAGTSGETVVDGRSLTKFEAGVGTEATLHLDEGESVKLGLTYGHDKYEDSYVGFVGYGTTF